MAIDLLLDMDDDLIGVLKARAIIAGRSVEEVIREALLRYLDHGYEPLTEAQAQIMRPMIKLDIRSQ